MRIIIVGDGKVGHTLMKELSQEGHDIVIIDNNIEVVEKSLNTYDIMAIQGNGASYHVLKEAEADKADLLIAATSSDELNMLSCLIAKKIGAKRTVARIRNPEYSEQLFIMREELGLNMAINPEYSAAKEISRVIRFPSAQKIETFSRGKAELVQILVEKGSSLDGQPLLTIGQRFKSKILICAIERGDKIIIPKGDVVLQAGDEIYITASAGQVNTFVRNAGILKEKIKSVMIAGGGRISYYLAKMLEGAGIDIKIIEKDYKRATVLSEELPEVMIIHGDGTNHDLLLEEGINDTDAFVALTGNDEENIIVSMFASNHEVRKIITKVNNLDLAHLLDEYLLDTVISPRYITANQIVQYVRALQNSMGSNVQTLHRIINEQVEVLEFSVKINHDFLGIKLKDLDLKDNLLVSSIIRGKNIIVPGGEDTIELNDHVIIVTTIPYLRDFKDIVNQ
ncbi:MAG: Trk system potassium transporter TrkA [Clostridiales bacterium]|nr:Trk system potassium transporter TrkA [Clostridiales bacterium]